MELTKTPEMLVAEHMRDAASQLRQMAQSPEVAELALREEKRFAARVQALAPKMVSNPEPVAA